MIKISNILSMQCIFSDIYTADSHSKYSTGESQGMHGQSPWDSPTQGFPTRGFPSPCGPTQHDVSWTEVI